VIYQKHCPGCFVNKSGLAVCPHCGYDESAPRTPLYLPHGVVIGGQYRVGRVLGQPGGFGITYIAWDVHLQQRVAIKEYLPRSLAARAEQGEGVVLLSPEGEAAFKEGLEQFLNEARVIARFDHPNIVRVRNFFRANDTAYLVMDYYEGVSLGDYLAGLDGSRVPPDVAVQLLAPVLDGLQFVHDRGLVHRDVKPHNIYLAQGGRTILLDFGAARAAADGEGQGAVLLSEGYAPLEQYQRGSPLGPWTDLYSVAATLYRMVIGAPPPAALDRVGQDAIAQPLGLDAGFERVLRKGLALAVADRYRSAYDMRADLFAALDLLDDHSPRLGAVGTVVTSSEPQTRPIDEPVTAPVEPVPPPEASSASVGRPQVTAMPSGLSAAWIIAAAIVFGAAMIAAVLWLRLSP
jgi:serine/threonine protein kinase